MNEPDSLIIIATVAVDSYLSFMLRLQLF